MEIEARISFNKDIINITDNQVFPIKYNNKVIGNGKCMNGILSGVIEDKDVIEKLKCDTNISIGSNIGM